MLEIKWWNFDRVKRMGLSAGFQDNRNTRIIRVNPPIWLALNQPRRLKLLIILSKEVLIPWLLQTLVGVRVKKDWLGRVGSSHEQYRWAVYTYIQVHIWIICILCEKRQNVMDVTNLNLVSSSSSFFHLLLHIILCLASWWRRIGLNFWMSYYYKIPKKSPHCFRYLRKKMIYIIHKL